MFNLISIHWYSRMYLSPLTVNFVIHSVRTKYSHTGHVHVQRSATPFTWEKQARVFIFTCFILLLPLLRTSSMYLARAIQCQSLHCLRVLCCSSNDRFPRMDIYATRFKLHLSDKQTTFSPRFRHQWHIKDFICFWPVNHAVCSTVII